MTRVDEYRLWAAMCLRIGQKVIHSERRAQLVEMAQQWYDLADRVEDRSKERRNSSNSSEIRRINFESEGL